MPGMGGMGWGMGCRWSPVPGVLTLGVCGLGLDLEPGPGPGVFGGAAEGFALGILGITTGPTTGASTGCDVVG